MDKDLTKKYLTAPIVTVGGKEYVDKELFRGYICKLIAEDRKDENADYVGISEMIEQVVWNA